MTERDLHILKLKGRVLPRHAEDQPSKYCPLNKIENRGTDELLVNFDAVLAYRPWSHPAGEGEVLTLIVLSVF